MAPAGNSSSSPNNSNSASIGLVDPLLAPVNSDSIYHDSNYTYHPDQLEDGISKPPSSDHLNSLNRSIFSYVCTTVGAGVLALPSGLAPIGWLGALIIVFVSIACGFTAQLICCCLFAGQSISGRRMTSYEDIGEVALGGLWGRRLVMAVQLVTLFGVPCIFLVLIGGNMNALVPSVTSHEWAFIAGAILIPIAWLKSMREVSLLSYLGVSASIFVGMVVIIRGLYIAVNGDYGTDPTGKTVEISHSHQWFDITGLPSAINVIVFGLGAHSVIPHIVNEMETPQKNYRKFSYLSYLFVGIIYTSVAFCGYAGWGSNTGDDCFQGNILNNISNNCDGYPTAPNGIDIFVKVARAVIIIHVLTAYPILLNPVSILVEKTLGVDKLEGSAELTRRIILRTLLVLLTVLVASVVPYFSDILQLVSALSLIIAAFVFPPIFYYLLHKDTRPFALWEKIGLLSIVIIGVLFSSTGVYYAIKGLIDDIEKNPPFQNYF